MRAWIRQPFLNLKRRKKSFIQKLLGRVMPQGAKKIPLSKMNFCGFGKAMLGKLMKDKGVEEWTISCTMPKS